MNGSPEESPVLGSKVDQGAPKVSSKPEFWVSQVCYFSDFLGLSELLLSVQIHTLSLLALLWSQVI